MGIGKEKEELARSKAELAVACNAFEAENRQLAEIIAGLRSEKEGLETSVFETQQSLTLLENKKESLEAENQEMLLRKEQLNGELQRIRQQGESENEKHEREKEALLGKMATANEESKKAVKMERDSHEEDVERLTREKL